eukprot:NODE_2219_length_446_cov_56.846348_g2139_i0.p4 GENE.NODE_2219_length_446_cov_56.846348_g2139_i0~~NODE_2219_length_446_cov_56.846348_g2139_i0.p4  ORF type:complete len:52 (-),score=29.16 NODE_2219_length_446_cov_56.846348_g2139_i0:291-425(-)
MGDEVFLWTANGHHGDGLGEIARNAEGGRHQQTVEDAGGGEAGR